MKDLYTKADSAYLEKTKTWHVEDSLWKANQISRIIAKNNLSPRTIIEVGCGAGEILYNLNKYFNDESVIFEGYDPAIDAIKMARSKHQANVKFYCEDFTTVKGKFYDLLLMIDVFEHVPDYMGLIEDCRHYATYKIFHIPLDIHCSAIIRNGLIASRKSVGHLHYFTKETALATLVDCGLKIVDYCYTYSAEQSTLLRTKIANLPRKFLFPLAPDLTVKLLGGYALLVLAE